MLMCYCVRACVRAWCKPAVAVAARPHLQRGRARQWWAHSGHTSVDSGHTSVAPTHLEIVRQLQHPMHLPRRQLKVQQLRAQQHLQHLGRLYRRPCCCCCGRTACTACTARSSGGCCGREGQADLLRGNTRGAVLKQWGLLGSFLAASGQILGSFWSASRQLLGSFWAASRQLLGSF
jgi:hypothetical protein